MALIIIDCGHNRPGTSDRGARCADGRMENDLNRIVTDKLTALLSAAGHSVIPIGDDASSVTQRGAVGTANNCDLMLSIHHNAYGQNANGTTVIKSVFADRECPQIALLGKTIQAQLVDALGTRSRNGGEPAIRWNSTNTADYYGVIRGNTKHNTLIIESLFCDNPSDLARWDPDKIAAAIAGAVYGVFGRPTAAAAAAETEAAGKTAETFTVGEILEFSGGSHYTSSDAANPVGGMRTAGKAKLTKIAAGRAHPYHLIGTTSNVYGWVDAASVSR